MKKAEEQKDHEAVKALSGLTYHMLRHTFGSWKVQEGCDILYVSSQMGHSKPSITFDIYSHLIRKRRPESAAYTDSMLFPAITDCAVGATTIN